MDFLVPGDDLAAVDRLLVASSSLSLSLSVALALAFFWSSQPSASFSNSKSLVLQYDTVFLATRLGHFFSAVFVADGVEEEEEK
jgi:O-antigen ligase